MPRRTHKKSRGGCVTCKRRHVKCDESKPRCVNCTTAEILCQYFAPPVEGSRKINTPLNRRAQTDVLKSSAPDVGSQGTASNPSVLPTTGARSGPLVDLDSIELLHHWHTMTCTTMTPESDQQEMWRTTAVKYGLAHPFLLHEILAISALHMAVCYPDKQDFCITRATELQSDALRRFNEIKVTDESNCIAVFLFSSLLGVHLLADRSRTRGIGFSEYLDHMLGCIGLFRSVMKLVLRDFTPYFMSSDIKCLMRHRNAKPPYENIPIQCRDLDDLINESDLGPSSVAVYRAAIDRLYWLFSLIEVPSVTHNTARWAIGWPIQLPDEYITLLNQRRPEALIILAYYGVALHSYREAWTIGDTGAVLITAINAQVGSFWGRWLAWPLQMIDAT